MRTAIGQRIRAARERYGMTGAELARRIGISGTALYDIEAGRSEPLAGRIEAIARVLNVTTDELHGLTNAEEAEDRRRLPSPQSSLEQRRGEGEPTPLDEACVRSVHRLHTTLHRFLCTGFRVGAQVSGQLLALSPVQSGSL